MVAVLYLKFNKLRWIAAQAFSGHSHRGGDMIYDGYEGRGGAGCGGHMKKKKKKGEKNKLAMSVRTRPKQRRRNGGDEY